MILVLVLLGALGVSARAFGVRQAAERAGWLLLFAALAGLAVSMVWIAPPASVFFAVPAMLALERGQEDTAVILSRIKERSRSRNL